MQLFHWQWQTLWRCSIKIESPEKQHISHLVQTKLNTRVNVPNYYIYSECYHQFIVGRVLEVMVSTVQPKFTTKGSPTYDFACT